MLIEMIGPELGLIDQELARLALLAGSDKKIRWRWCGGWWAAGGPEPPGKCSTPPWTATSPRRCSSSTGCWRRARRRSACSRRFPPRCGGWPPPREHPPGRGCRPPDHPGRGPGAGRRADLRHREGRAAAPPPGPRRGSQLYRWLLETDLDLKGGSACPRDILERLIVWLAAAQ